MTMQAKILLVDDEAAITDNLAPFLSRAGFVVEVASDGQQGNADRRDAKQPHRGPAGVDHVDKIV